MGFIGSSVAYTAPTATTGATTLAIAPPAGYAAGNLLIMAAVGGGTTAGTVYPSTPAGWTALTVAGSPFGVFWKTAASEPGSYTITFSAVCVSAATVVAYTSAAIMSSLFTASAANVGSFTPSQPNVTAADTVVMFSASESSSLVNSTTGLTEQGSESLSLPPSGWTAQVPPFGPGLEETPPAAADLPVNIGVCDAGGGIPAATVTSPEDSILYAGFVVLGSLLVPLGLPPFYVKRFPYRRAVVGNSLACGDGNQVPSPVAVFIPPPPQPMTRGISMWR